MLDILSSPLRGYIAQNLQFYLSKYIEGIQLEGLGLFGGDLVLNDLEIKRHVLAESLEIPSSFDFSRGFIRELRIHIPWTQLLSQPIEVKLYTVELILTARDPSRRHSVDSAMAARHSARTRSIESASSKEASEIENPKSGWLRDTLQKILANVTIQVNNLVMKYEQDDVVLSVALGVLDCYSVSETRGWARSFVDPQGSTRAISRVIEAKDLTIFLDRYTSDRSQSDLSASEIRRRVVGYEVPVLSRTSLSIRGRIQLKPKSDKEDEPKMPLSATDSTASYEPSNYCDPFFSYSCSRNNVIPMLEVDAFIGELSFSLSDRQLQMISEMTRRPSTVVYDEELDEADYQAVPVVTSPIESAPENPEPMGKQKQSWFGWAMKTLGGPENGAEDELESELLAATKRAIQRQQPVKSPALVDGSVVDKPLSWFVSCFRVCVSSTSLTLRKHEEEKVDDLGEDTTQAQEEEYVPVANLGLVRVPVKAKKSRVSRPAVPVFVLTLAYSAMECITVRGEKEWTDIVCEIESVEFLRVGTVEEKPPLIRWGFQDLSDFSDCVGHPYFAASFFGEESRRHTKRETRSFEIVKVSFDREVPVWKTLERRDSTQAAESCDCSFYSSGTRNPCIPLMDLSKVARTVVADIGVNERVLNEQVLTATLSAAWRTLQGTAFDSSSVSYEIRQIVSNYRKLRDPDVSATQNLEMNLIPQLCLLLARKYMHSCVTTGSLSSKSGDVRSRSAHSAFRMRYFVASTKKESNQAAKDGSKRCLVDVSLGPAKVNVSSDLVSDMMDLVWLIGAKSNPAEQSEAKQDQAENGREATQDVTPPAAKISKLVTVSSIEILIPQALTSDTSTPGSVARVAIRDMAWYSSGDGRIDTQNLTVGVANAAVLQRSPQSANPVLLEIVGAVWRTHRESGSASMKLDREIRFDKTFIQLDWVGIFEWIKSFHVIFQYIGISPIEALPERPLHTARVQCLEACNWALHEFILSRGDFGKSPSTKAYRVTLQSFAIYSASTVMTFPIRNIFSAGDPTFGGTDGARMPMITIRFDQMAGHEMVTGASGGENSVSVDAQAAVFDTHLGDLIKFVSRVNGFFSSLSFKHRQNQLNDDVVQPPQPCILSQKLHAGIKIHGGTVMLTSMLRLTVPTLTISASPVVDSRDQEHRRSKTKLAWQAGDIEIVNVWKEQGPQARVLDVVGLAGWLQICESIQHDAVSREVEMTSQVTKVDVFLTRLSLNHVTKIGSYRVAESTSSGRKTNAKRATSAKQVWNVRCGIQLDRITTTLQGSLTQKLLSTKSHQISSKVTCIVNNIGVAYRQWNRRPRSPAQKNGDAVSAYIDFQAYAKSISANETQTVLERVNRHRFGRFESLPEHAFLGVLLCLGAEELNTVAEAVYSPLTASSPDIPPAIAVWHGVNQVARLFRKSKPMRTESREEAVSVPLIVTNIGENSMRAGKAPVVSFYYRNYDETSDSKHVIGASVENSDMLLSSSAIMSAVSVFGALSKQPQPPGIHHKPTRDRSTGNPRLVYLEDIQVSVVVGRLRVFLADVQDVKDIICEITPAASFVCVALEGSTISTARWSDISVDGLGYPPFNSTMLPRRLKALAQRFGDVDHARLACRFGSIHGSIVRLSECSSGADEDPRQRGLLELLLSHENGRTFDLLETDIFLCPFSFSVDVEEKGGRKRHGTVSEVNSRVSATKVRAEAQKKSFDMIVSQIGGVLDAFAQFNRISPRRDGKLTKENTRANDALRQTVVEVVCDGFDLALVENASVHLRVGELSVVHNSDGSGSFRVDNVVIGYRNNKQLNQDIFKEELIFGPNQDPAAWQLSVDSFPDALVTGRWAMPRENSVGEGSLFVDCRGLQLNVSIDFLEALMPLISPIFTRRYAVEPKIRQLPSRVGSQTAFRTQRRTVIKVLLAQSTLLLWVRPSKDRGDGIALWSTIDQVFVSVGVGATKEKSVIPTGDQELSNHQLTRYASVPVLDFMLTVERVSLKTSNQVTPLAVRCRNDSLGSVPSQIDSSWPQHWKLINSKAAYMTILQESTIRMTGDRSCVVEVSRGQRWQTPLSATSVQLDATGLVLRVSSFCLQTLTVLHSRLSSHLTARKRSAQESNSTSTKDSNTLSSNDETSEDDFAGLRRGSGSRLPGPGELVFSESLLIETDTSQASAGPSISPLVDLHVDFVPSQPGSVDIFDETTEVLEWINVVNGPWNPEPTDVFGEPVSAPVEATTKSWMSMKWSYHLPRRVVGIDVSAVPVPPIGLPRGWPRWHWAGGNVDDRSGRPCDVVCQLRAWDHVTKRYVLVCEFLVPWDIPNRSKQNIGDFKGTGGFGDLVSLWFDAEEKEEQVKYHRVLEVTSAPRFLQLKEALVSDKWEMRWRSPLSGEKHQQIRLHVSALLAASIQIRSLLDTSAFQRLSVQCSVPRVGVAVAFAEDSKTSYDVLSAELKESTLAVTSYAGNGETRALVQSSLQVYLENMVQLLTVSIIPRLDIHANVRTSRDSSEISLVLGNADVFLSQTAILVLYSIPDILSQRRSLLAHGGGDLSKVRIEFVNSSGWDVWYRQEGTAECLLLERGKKDAYSWLTLDRPAYNRVQFALSTGTDSSPALTDLSWSDPCRIQENCVTGRYFKDHGFMWIAVETIGMKTVVSLRGGVSISNFTDVDIDLEVTTKNQPSLLLSVSPCPKTPNGLTKKLASDQNAVGLMLDQLEDSKILLSPSKNLTLDISGLPQEFDLAPSDGTVADQTRRRLISFESSQGQRHVWAEALRVESRLAILPTDFDNEQPRFGVRYTWVQVNFHPAICIQNLVDDSLRVELSTQDGDSCCCVVQPNELHFSSEVNAVQVRALVISSNNTGVQETELGDLGSCRRYHTEDFVIDVDPVGVKPYTSLTIRRPLCVVNNSQSVIFVTTRKSSQDENKDQIKLSGGSETTVAHTVQEKNAMILVALGASESSSEEDGIAWSPEFTLSWESSTQCCCVVHKSVPASREGLPFVVKLIRENGDAKIVISPLVVLHNETGYQLKFASTDGGDAFIDSNYDTAKIDHERSLDVTVCFPVPTRRRNISIGGLTSWLSSTMTRRNEASTSLPPDRSIQDIAARCSFVVSICDDTFSWTDEVQVRLPNLFPNNRAGKSPAVPNATYLPPSSVTSRHRLVVRSSEMRHVMLTYTISQVDDGIHILFFVDHQPSIVLHNKWHSALGVGLVSAFSTRAECIGANHYMEYDWSLQTQPSRSTNKNVEANPAKLESWLDSSAVERYIGAPSSDQSATRFQIGHPDFGWSNLLWQVPGIQFARFSNEVDSGSPVFLVATIYRAGSWQISVTCLDEPGSIQVSFGSSADPMLDTAKSPAGNLQLVIASDQIRIHCCDEHSPHRDERGALAYNELFQLVLRAPTIAFESTPEAPVMTRTEDRLGYLQHVRSYSTFFFGLETMELDHFVDNCNFPVVLSVKLPDFSPNDILPLDVAAKHDELRRVLSLLKEQSLPQDERSCLALRVIHVETWDPSIIPSYFQNVEVKIAPAVIQIEDELIVHVQVFMRPVLDGIAGLVATRIRARPPKKSMPVLWMESLREKLRITSQQRVFIDHLDISRIELTITARISLPVLSSFDGTPLRFGQRSIRQVFTFSDQLYKDLAAEYVADVIVRSPMLLMSLNIFGNPAGFFRHVGTGMRDLFEIPFAAASRDGFNPWILTKGVFGGIASLIGHTSAAALSSIAGFSYSISRTVDHITLTPEQLRKKHYVRPAHLTTAIAGGLGSLGSSVVGAATGIVSTPLAMYQEKREQGLRAGVSGVVGGLGMGLVGIVARPMGGVAALVAMASDGILYGTGFGGIDAMDESDREAMFDARPNELLRFKLKVLRDPSVGELIVAHGVWMNPDVSLLLPGIDQEELQPLSEEEKSDERVSELFTTQAWRDQSAVVIIVAAMRDTVFVIALFKEHLRHVIVSKTSLAHIQAIEESLTEPSRLDLGVQHNEHVHWYNFRLFTSQRRELSRQLRQWMLEGTE